MRILWVNNVPSLCGGTANCTLSMVKSFPDCQHTVLALSGQFTREDKQLFGDNVQLVTGPTPERYLRENQFDLVVYQNTGVNSLPQQPPNGIMSVYVAHSPAAPVRDVPNRCQKMFVVSEFLKRKLKIDWQVIHQPVQKPDKRSALLNVDESTAEFLSEQLQRNRVLIGRICTPSERKWRVSDFGDSLLAVDRDDRYLKSFHFIGATDEAKDFINDNVKSPVCFTDASPHARGYMPYWDVLLYDTTVEETFGRTVREAQRAGCVPVVRKIGGFVEQIKHAHDGWLCESNGDFVLGTFAAQFSREQFRNNCLSTGDTDGSLTLFRTRFLSLLTT